MTVLTIAAHPDDEVLGCGGTMAKLSESGQDVFVAILGEGVTSRSPRQVRANREAIKTLRQHCISASNHLGVKQVFFYNFPDNRFDTVPLLDIVKKIEALIEQIRPESVFTHHPGDLNIDHRITHQAVLTAVRPFGSRIPGELHAFEIPSSTEWAFGQFREFKPNTFVDISTTIRQKTDAMLEYQSELRTFPHPRSIDRIESLAKVRGAAAGMTHGEAFSLIFKRM